MNNLCSQGYSQAHSHARYNIKLRIITSLEQRENVPRRKKCVGSPTYSRKHIVLANKTICKLLKQASNGY